MVNMISEMIVEIITFLFGAVVLLEYAFCFWLRALVVFHKNGHERVYLA
jgi:hypothetical protein